MIIITPPQFMDAFWDGMDTPDNYGLETDPGDPGGIVEITRASYPCEGLTSAEVADLWQSMLNKCLAGLWLDG